MLWRKRQPDLCEIARECRADFEMGRVSDEELFALYETHLPGQARGVERDLRYVRSRGFPRDHCRFAAVLLLDRLGQGKIDDGGYIAGNVIRPHSFVVLSETALGATIVDITADQFGGPTIYVGPLVEPWVSGSDLF